MILQKIASVFSYGSRSTEQKQKQKSSTFSKAVNFLKIGVLLLALALPLQSKAVFSVIAPTILLPEAQKLTTAKPLIAGVSVNDTAVEIYLDGSLAATVKTSNHPSGVGNFAWQPTIPLGLGEHDIKVKAIDQTGQISSDFSKTININIVPFGGPTFLLADYVKTTSPFAYLQGVAHNNSTIKFFVDGALFDTFTLNSNPSGAVGFKHRLSVPITSGQHSLYLQAVDQTGRVSLPSKVKVLEIVNFPTPTILSPQDNDKIVEDKPVITGVAYNDSTITIIVDGAKDGEITVLNHSSGVAGFSYQLKKSVERGKEHLIYAQAADKNGRVSQLSKGVSIIALKPYIPPTLLRITKDAGKVKVGGVAHNDSLIHVFVDGKLDSVVTPINDQSGTLYFEAPLDIATSTAGIHRITAKAYDDQGKGSLISNVLSYFPSGLAPVKEPAPQPTDSQTSGTPSLNGETPTGQDGISVKEGASGEIADLAPEVSGEIIAGDGDDNKIELGAATGGSGFALGAVTNWPLVLGLVILIGLAIIFVIWYLGQKRRLLNEGIDKLFSDEEDMMSVEHEESGMAEEDLKETEELKIKESEKASFSANDKSRHKKGRRDFSDNMPPPPPSI